MLTLAQLTGELVGTIPGLPHPLAAKLANRAWADVRNEKNWGWLVEEGILVIPAAITSGTVAVTNLSASITFDATAQAAILGQVLGNPPLTDRQVRFGGGPIYSIRTYDTGTGVATLDRIYGEATNSAALYSIYRCYYAPPAVDFKRFLSITNTTDGYTIRGVKLYIKPEVLNALDPLRAAIGQPYRVAPVRSSTASATLGQLVHELWPHPITAMNLKCTYQRSGEALSGSTTLPLPCDEQLITCRAMNYAARWAMANQGREPKLKGGDWRSLVATTFADYRDRLKIAKKEDNEIYGESSIVFPGTPESAWGPIDSNFAQSHDWPALS